MPEERVLYGVQGEGRGHASRSLQIIQWLRGRGYRVKVLTGGDALQVLGGQGFDLEEVPLLRYRFRSDGVLDPWRTLRENLVAALGLFCGTGFRYGRVSGIVREFGPDLIISDFEPYLSRLAPRLRIPLLAIDHQHFLTESVLPALAGWQKTLALKLYQVGTRLLAGRPDRIITSSFWHFPRKRASRAIFVGPFIPGKLKRLRNAGEDGSITVYLKQPAYLESLLPAFAARPETRFRVFSHWPWPAPAGLPANLELSGIDRDAFLSQLARGSALITTAGNQVIGEAIYLHKPVLAFPEPDVLEQELNAAALRLSGYGDVFRLEEFSAGRWDAFAAGLSGFRARMAAGMRDARVYDGRRAALQVLRRFLREVSHPAPRAVKSRSRLSFSS
jgi:uncharacterized protein (TIGR00661 family)